MPDKHSHHSRHDLIKARRRFTVVNILLVALMAWGGYKVVRTLASVTTTIKGTVYVNGKPKSGIRVECGSNTALHYPVTNSSGVYSCTITYGNAGETRDAELYHVRPTKPAGAIGGATKHGCDTPSNTTYEYQVPAINGCHNSNIADGPWQHDDLAFDTGLDFSYKVPVTVKGRAYDKRTGKGIPGIVIETCNAGQRTTDSSGNYSFSAMYSTGYCLRPQSGKPAGYSGPTTIQNPEIGNSTTHYEYQIAGKNCYHNADGGCGGPQLTWDRPTDSGLDFIYTSPAPPAPGVTLKVNGVDQVTVPPSTTVRLSWSSTGSPTSCSASGSWSGSQKTANTVNVNVGSSTGTKSYKLSCTNPSGTGSDTVTVIVKKGAPKPVKGCGPGTDNSTCKGGPIVTSPSGQADHTAPTVPGDFKAGLGADKSIVLLSWSASADASGIKAYQIERSADQTKWATLKSNISGTKYTDSATDFKTVYFYRVKAIDNAGNSSGYAKTDITTGAFTATKEGSTISSDDKIVQVFLPDGSLGANASCTIDPSTDNTDSLKDVKLQLIYGPYAILCKTADGEALTTFLKPIDVHIYPQADKTKHYKTVQVFVYNQDNSAWQEVQVDTTNDNGQVVLSFKAANPLQLAVLGQPKPGLPLGIFSFIFLIILAAVIAFIILLRRAQKQHYHDYLRRKYYNL